MAASRHRLSVLRARQRPVSLGAHVVRVDRAAHLEAHARLALHAVIFALQKVVEETPLTSERVLAVVHGPLAAPVRVEPFLPRADALVRVEATFGVQPLVRKAPADQRRHLDLLQLCGVRAHFGDWRRAAGPFGRAGAFGRGIHVALPTAIERGLRHTAVEHHVAVRVRRTFPRHDRRELRRRGRCRVPLTDCQVRHAVQRDPPVAPRLRGRPLDDA